MFDLNVMLKTSSLKKVMYIKLIKIFKNIPQFFFMASKFFVIFTVFFSM